MYSGKETEAFQVSEAHVQTVFFCVLTHKMFCINGNKRFCISSVSNLKNRGIFYCLFQRQMCFTNKRKREICPLAQKPWENTACGLGMKVSEYKNSNQIKSSVIFAYKRTVLT
ncbi:hypothetical protein CRENBAI_026136 [Crenichthys baileyi]|uniref:Uncharacterized protein n=1 Tax=Crenichthys baileyi TaxID=28760 RepID=A0AAV9RSV3_9TELE